MMRTIGHLDAAHKLAHDVTGRITVGEFNTDPKDTTRRCQCINKFLETYNYDSSDLKFYSEDEYTHKGWRLIDRLVSSSNLSNDVTHVVIIKVYYALDHFPVMAKVALQKISEVPVKNIKINLCWNKASEKAI